MKKIFFLLSASVLISFTSCGPTGEEKAQQGTQQTDSVKEQKNLDSLFDVAGKNMDASRDTSMKKDSVSKK